MRDRASYLIEEAPRRHHIHHQSPSSFLSGSFMQWHTGSASGGDLSPDEIRKGGGEKRFMEAGSKGKYMLTNSEWR